MLGSTTDDDYLLWRLQCQLPLLARGRPALLALLRSRGVIGNVSSRLKIVGVVQPGQRGDFMCRFVIEGGTNAETFLAPLAQLALDRRYPIARELVRHRLQTVRPGATSSGESRHAKPPLSRRARP